MVAYCGRFWPDLEAAILRHSFAVKHLRHFFKLTPALVANAFSTAFSHPIHVSASVRFCHAVIVPSASLSAEGQIPVHGLPDTIRTTLSDLSFAQALPARPGYGSSPPGLGMRIREAK